MEIEHRPRSITYYIYYIYCIYAHTKVPIHMNGKETAFKSGSKYSQKLKVSRRYNLTAFYLQSNYLLDVI